jgi:hypothetical protein
VNQKGNIVESHVTSDEICGGRSGTGVGSPPPSSSVSPANHHSTIAAYYHHPMRCAIALTKQHIIIPQSSVSGFISDRPLDLSQSKGSFLFFSYIHHIYTCIGHMPAYGLNL